MGKYLFVLILIFFSNNIYAEDINQKKSSIAINQFSAINCPDSFAKSAEELFAGKIFKSKIFSLVEKSQMAVVLKKYKIRERKSLDIGYVTRIGKILSVDKMVVGSISKLDKYKIKISVINIKDARVEFTAVEECNGIDEFDSLLEKIFQDMESFFLGKFFFPCKYSLSLSPIFIYPKGDFAEDLNSAYGLNLVFSHYLVSNKVRFNYLTGIYSFQPEKGYIDSFYMIPLEFSISYPYNVGNLFKISPSFGGGYFLSQKVYDKIKNRNNNNYIYETEYYYNPLLSLKVESDIRISNHFSISSTIFYTLFFEEESRGHLLGIDLGAKFLF